MSTEPVPCETEPVSMELLSYSMWIAANRGAAGAQLAMDSESLGEDFRAQKASELLKLNRAIARAKAKLLVLESYREALLKVPSEAAAHEAP